MKNEFKINLGGVPSVSLIVETGKPTVILAENSIMVDIVTAVLDSIPFASQGKPFNFRQVPANEIAYVLDKASIPYEVEGDPLPPLGEPLEEDEQS